MLESNVTKEKECSSEQPLVQRGGSLCDDPNNGCEGGGTSGSRNLFLR